MIASLVLSTAILSVPFKEQGVPSSVLHRLAKGANVCRWFRFPDPETNDHFEHYISSSEAHTMRKLGLTHVRLCIAPKYIMNPDDGSIIEKYAASIDRAIEMFEKEDLLVVVDIHNEDRKVEGDAKWESNFINFWGQYAKRLTKYDTSMTVLEVINEPVFDKHEDHWMELNPLLVKRIRMSAPKNTIITSGPNWGGIYGLLKMKPVDDRNVVYSFHCYDPFPFTHQGATWAGPDVQPLKGVPYPADPDSVAPLLAALAAKPGSKNMLENYGKERWNKSKMEENFKQAIEWGKQYGVPLYCGEFGVFPQNAKPEHRANWFRDFGQVLAENKIGWSVWGWDEGFGLNRQMVDGQPYVDGVVAKALGLNKE